MPLRLLQIFSERSDEDEIRFRIREFEFQAQVAATLFLGLFCQPAHQDKLDNNEVFRFQPVLIRRPLWSKRQA